ncbi:MAG: CoA transferase [Chloroflexi bacterium]|nr:CoA transferase [Chloroflexota bacterium]
MATYHPGWVPAGDDDPDMVFEHQVARAVRQAEFAADLPYQAVLGDADALERLTPGLPSTLVADASTVEITSPLGTGESFAETLVSDMALWARSGLGYLTREVVEDYRLGAPCLPLNRQPSLLAGLAAATAAAALAIDRSRGGVARRLTVDKLELLALLPMQPVAFAQIGDRIVGREAGPVYPGGTMPSADGLVYVRPVEPSHWARLFEMVDGLGWASTQIESAPQLLLEAYEELDARLRDWALDRTTDELVDACQAAHIPVARIVSPEAAVRSKHLDARSFFRKPADGGGLNLPWRATVGAPSSTHPRATRQSVRSRGELLPLSGLRVLDLTWAWAGPFATTMLADLGAEVVNIEWHPRASNLRRNPPYAGGRDASNNTAGWWSANQRGKLSVGVNMKTAGGNQVIRDLAACSDIVVENFSPGVVSRLGVGYEDLIKVNSRLVYASLSAFGQTGPYSHYVGYGTQLYAESGAGFATSHDGETYSSMWIPYPDPVSGLAGAFAIAAYARSALATGRSAYLDVSELESLSCILLEPMLSALEREGGSDGGSRKAHSYVVVEVSPARFVALLARDPSERERIARSLDAEDFSTEAIRRAAAGISAEQLLTRLGELGFVAVPVHDSEDCVSDPYLQERGFWIRDQSPEIAPSGTRIGGAPWILDGDRAPIWRGAPPLFGDTRDVLERVTGYDAATIDQLFDVGAVS